MTDTPFSISRYLSAPREICPRAEDRLADVADEINALATASRLTVWQRLKALARALSATEPQKTFDVRLTSTLTPRAYMRDGGDIFFSIGAILSRSPVVTLSVFCHEYAHLSLSYETFYPALKTLNRQFKGEFSHLSNSTLLSPIELCAMLRSVTLMETMAGLIRNDRAKEKLALLIRAEQEKLDQLESQLKALQ